MFFKKKGKKLLNILQQHLQMFTKSSHVQGSNKKFSHKTAIKEIVTISKQRKKNRIKQKKVKKMKKFFVQTPFSTAIHFDELQTIA